MHIIYKFLLIKDRLNKRKDTHAFFLNYTEIPINGYRLTDKYLRYILRFRLYLSLLYNNIFSFYRKNFETNFARLYALCRF